MVDYFDDELKNFIDKEGRDLKYKVSDVLNPLNFRSTPTISYDYILINPSREYSFSSVELNQILSEECPGLSDAQIYFNKIHQICRSDFSALIEDVNFFQIVSPNRKLKEIVDFIFDQKLQANQVPSFFEIKLYTNKSKNRAPRVFGFIGNFCILYILFYDPFHDIYAAVGKL